MDRYESLLASLGRFVVRVSGAEVPGGTGFFVAPGTVLTCAHAVGAREPRSEERAAVRRVRVSWDGGEGTGAVTALPPVHDGRGLWPFPDLAVVELPEPVPDQGWVPLVDTMPAVGDQLYAAGYSAVYEKGEPRLGGTTVEYEFPQAFDGHGLLKVKGGELPPGMSGGPLLVPGEGYVCAVVTTTRREGLPHGGLAVPVSAVREYFPELWERNQRPPAHLGGWRRTLSALRHDSAYRSLLSDAERRALVAAAEELRLEPAALYMEAVGDLAPPLDGPLEDIEAVLRECADTQAVGFDAPHPLVRLVEVVAGRTSVEAVARHLTDLAGHLSARLGLTYNPAAAPVVEAVAKGGPRVRLSSVEVRLEPDGSNHRRSLLSIWKYPDVNEMPVPVLCLDTPMTLVQIREQVKKVLPGAVRSLAGHADDLVVEFTFPSRMLHRADVDEWNLGKDWAPLGAQFMVVLRALDRPVETHGHWERRWRSLQSAEGGDARPTVDWVDCRNADTIDKLFATFQRAPSLAVLAVSYQPDNKAGKLALQAALYAGVPAAIWPRTPCPTHGDAPAGQAPAKESADATAPEVPFDCTGDRFLAAVAPHLSDTALSDLPQLVKSLRLEARAQDHGVDHCGRGLTLLWDDPTRWSPTDGAALAAPAPG
ncbi:VMAP-related conflict system protein [Streptomyces sp. NPDC000983]|uniref:VMAP-C domain-containing protein n=1 Tax=Streptomyces sp. NPDC000983 TaxID=3154373 RepID=UPI00331D655C